MEEAPRPWCFASVDFRFVRFCGDAAGSVVDVGFDGDWGVDDDAIDQVGHKFAIDQVVGH